MSTNQNQHGGLESELVLVRTRLGFKPYPKSKRVYAHPEKKHVFRVCGDAYPLPGRALLAGLLEDSYARKDAGELEKGECLLLDLEDIDVRLGSEFLRNAFIRPAVPSLLPVPLLGADRFDSWLTSIIDDEDYIQAKERLFVDIEGRTVPRFQRELLAAVAKEGLIDEETLPDRLAENDVTHSYVKDAIDYLFSEYGKLEDPGPVKYVPLTNVPKKGRSAFQSYLTGNRLAPNHPGVLRGLGEVLDHEPFLEMYEEGKAYEERRTAFPDVSTLWGAKDFYSSERRKSIGLGALVCEEVVEVTPLEEKINQ